MVIEDAVVFGTLFSHLAQWEQIPVFLDAYQELREGRTKTVKVKDVQNFQIMWLPPGPMRDARDANLPSADVDMDEGVLKRQLEDLMEIFGYNATDAAQEWWMDWGRFTQPKESRGSFRLAEFVGE